jgi:hypothetical protein
VVVQTTVANVTGGGGGGGAPSAHASTHQSGGSDALALGSIAGSLTLAQHGTLATGDPHPQYATDTDVATVQTNVDNLAAGMRFKDSVRVATTANINIASPGTAIIDGVTLTSGDSVLLAGQTTQSQNGAYTFNGSGSAMTRRADSNTSGEVKAATVYPVDQGTFADQLAVLTTNDPITLSVTALAFQFIAPGAGITASIIDAKGDMLVGTADNTIARFPVGANGTVPLADSTQPFGIRWGAPTTSSSAVFGSPDAELVVPAPVGASSITITRGSPSSWMGTKNMVNLGVGVPGVNFEARPVLSLSGNTFTFGYGFLLPHAAGEPVWWISNNELRPWMYGLGNPGATANFQTERIQFIRMLWDAVGTQCKLEFDGGKAHANNCIPFPDSIRTRGIEIDFGNSQPANWVGPYQDEGACLWGHKYGPVQITASAATDRITTPAGGPFVATGVKTQREFMLVAAYGETMPGGLNEGQIYFADNISGLTFDVYATCSEANVVSNKVNITSDGTVMFCSGPSAIAKMRSEYIFLKGYPVAGSEGFNVFQFCSQQMSWLEHLNIYVASGTPGPGNGILPLNGTYRWLLKNPPLQGLNASDYTLTATDAAGYRIWDNQATFMALDGQCYMDSQQTDATPAGVRILGRTHRYTGGFWMESAGGIEIGSNAVDLYFGPGYGAPSGGTAYHDTAADDSASYTIASHRIGNNGREFYVNDYWGVAYHGWNNPRSLIQSTIGDQDKMSIGIEKRSGQPPMLTGRWGPGGSGWTSDQIATLINSEYQFDCAGGARTLTLPTNDCAGANTYIVQRISGSNSLTIAPNGHTIDGAATKVITDNHAYLVYPKVVSGSGGSFVYQWQTRQMYP